MDAGVAAGLVQLFIRDGRGVYAEKDVLLDCS